LVKKVSKRVIFIAHPAFKGHLMASRPVKIVIPGDDPPQLQGSPHLERLRSHGEVVLYPDRPTSFAEQIRRLEDAECLINSRGAVKWPGEVLRQLPRLKMITTCGIGTDAIDLSTARELGIIVSNIPGRTAPIVAEHALALMLAVARRLAFQTQQLKEGRWNNALDYVFLSGKTLGIIGTGSIGAATARLGRAIGMNVQAWTMHPSDGRAAELGVRFVPLDDLLRTSDIISIHVKLTDRSRGLIGQREFGLMKPGALFINTARGAIADTAALVAALRSGRLGGAGIDVFDEEPLPARHPLLGCEQVVLTPHNADQTPEGMDILNGGVVDNVIAYLEGRPQNRVV
jgi:D-3-phosphoglycerate dehydrogenase